MHEAILFAGPSAHGIDGDLFVHAGVELRPPVRRGEVDRLLDEADGAGTLIVCDGVFEVAPAVAHGELCRAIDAGWQVWGVASLGAIRAFELRGEGMRGFGYVYEMFEQFDDFTDDEMCLLHCPEPPYFPASEALVNVRHALDHRRRPLGMADAACDALISALRALWFGDRTEERLRSLLLSEAGLDERRAECFIQWLRQHRVKTLDLERLLFARPWRGDGRWPERP